MRENSLIICSRRLKTLVFSLLMVVTCAFGAAAQGILVSGTVSDAKGDALPGVSVTVKGTTKGVMTDAQGAYRLNQVNPDGVLVFSFVGMQTQEIKIAGKQVHNITMADDAQLLDDVVVVGYGTMKKSSLTGAVSAINGEDLLVSPSTNVTQVLAGKLPGISSVQESGEPGVDNASLRIRGSIYNVTYIVDGFPREIGDIDPNDIESVSVLKDAAAAAVYGLKAAGGVIIVTTKKGAQGKSKITYDGSVGGSFNTNFPEFCDGPEFAYYYNLGDMMDRMANGIITSPAEYVPIFSEQNIADMKAGRNGWGNVDYADRVFGTGVNQKHNVSVQGGTERLRYYASVGYMGQDGNIDNFYYKRYNLRSNIEADIAKDWKLSIGVSARTSKRHTPGYASGGTDSNSELGEQGWMSIANQTVRMHPYVPEKIDGVYTGTANNSGQSNSPLAAIYESGYQETRSTAVETNVALMP